MGFKDFDKKVQKIQKLKDRRDKRKAKAARASKREALCFAFVIGNIPRSDKELIDALIFRFSPDVEPVDYWIIPKQTLPSPEEIMANITLLATQKGYRVNLEKTQVCDFNIAVYNIEGKFTVMYF